jgi:adenylosuccinate synthase
MINGISALAMMKADVLSGFDTVKVCTAYKVNGVVTDRLPYDLSGTIEPVYIELPGWNCNGNAVPEQLEAYVRMIEKATGVRVDIVSLGPDRSQTVMRGQAAIA